MPKNKVLYLYYYNEMIQITIVTCRYKTKKQEECDINSDTQFSY